jgi:hypothetical protein
LGRSLIKRVTTTPKPSVEIPNGFSLPVRVLQPLGFCFQLDFSCAALIISQVRETHTRGTVRFILSFWAELEIDPSGNSSLGMDTGTGSTCRFGGRVFMGMGMGWLFSTRAVSTYLTRKPAGFAWSNVWWFGGLNHWYI